MIHEPSGERVRQQLVVPGIGPVEREDIVKGYEYEKGRYVNVDPDDIKRLRLETTDTIDISEFVDDIDPIYFDTPYYLVPDGSVAEEGYRVIREALRDSGKIAVGRVVINGQERIIALRPLGTGLLGNALRYPDEIRRPEDYFGSIAADAVDEDQLAIMQQIIARRSRDFEPEPVRRSLSGGAARADRGEARRTAAGQGTGAAAGSGHQSDGRAETQPRRGSGRGKEGERRRRRRAVPHRARPTSDEAEEEAAPAAPPARAKTASRGPQGRDGAREPAQPAASGIGWARLGSRQGRRKAAARARRGSGREAPQARLSRRVFAAALFVLGLDRAFVPAAQQQPRQKIEQPVDDDAGQRQHQQRREHARDRETVAGFENAEGEPGLGPAGPGDKLGDDRADQRQPAADPQPGEEIGQRGRDRADSAASAPARRRTGGTAPRGCGRRC